MKRSRNACQKCGSSVDLEAHHIKERHKGGADKLDNLCTLCGGCHDEITWMTIEPMPFEIWLMIPPARYLVEVFALAWPDNRSALAFKREVLAPLRAARIGARS